MQRGGVILLLFLTPFGGWAQAPVPSGESTSISGTVKDAEGAILSNVQVEVRNLATGSVRSTRTNMEGQFQLLGLPVGRYRVTWSATGFAARKEDISLGTGQALTLSLVLGGPVPRGDIREPPPTDATPKPPKGAVEVVEKSFDDVTKLQAWLHSLSQEKKHLVAVIPIKNQNSLFVVASGSKKEPAVLRVNQALRSAEVEFHIHQNLDKTFAGVHRLDDQSYLMVFLHGRN